MKRLLTLITLLLIFGTFAAAQKTKVPVCNAFNASGVPIDSVSNSTVCTDYFGVANWANSPLPAGQITGFTLISPGSGYVNPQVVITDITGAGATANATVDATGAVTGITGSGKIADSTWHLEDPRHPYLVALLHCSCCAVLRSSLLDLRCEEENRLGFLCAARRLKYVAHLSVAGFLLLSHRFCRYHVSRYTFQLRLAWRRESCCIHRFHSCDCCAVACARHSPKSAVFRFHNAQRAGRVSRVHRAFAPQRPHGTLHGVVQPLR